MSDRGVNHFIRAWRNFIRSLRPSTIRRLTGQGVEVGKDHLGNRYFEIPANPSHGVRNPSRYFKPLGKEMDNWDQPIPPEWNAWLRRQRPDPPSEAEMKYKLERIRALEAKRAPKDTEPFMQNDRTFPSYPEYEDTAGTKYKNE